VIFSLRISSNKFRENPTFEHLYFSGGLPNASLNLGIIKFNQCPLVAEDCCLPGLCESLLTRKKWDGLLLISPASKCQTEIEVSDNDKCGINLTPIIISQ